MIYFIPADLVLQFILFLSASHHVLLFFVSIQSRAIIFCQHPITCFYFLSASNHVLLFLSASNHVLGAAGRRLLEDFAGKPRRGPDDAAVRLRLGGRIFVRSEEARPADEDTPARKSTKNII